MVPIPEGVESSFEEPEDEDFSKMAQSDGGGSSKLGFFKGNAKSKKPAKSNVPDSSTDVVFADGNGNVASDGSSKPTYKVRFRCLF
jgi:hypothetical protein